MSGTGSFEMVLVVALLAASLVGVARLGDGRRVDPVWTTRESDAAHVVMNLSMAAMHGPLWGPTTRSWVLAVMTVGVLAAGLGVLRPPAGPGRRAALVQHLLAFATMGLVVLLGHDPAHGHGLPGGTPVAVVVVALAAWFAFDLVVTVVVALVGPPTRVLPAGVGAPVGRDLAAVRVAAVPHGVMDAAMVVMLLAAL
ncbi:DUF5134 domain-containing protein [Pseudonocardia alni]|uniref:DUF5134 domain-containing protein n=1 Tax=Pseudonocardia alni TaxID=33907 RepID=UPI001AD6FF30|nr:DUF5134 domain-containing protein [Pseudonocardia alni]MBO4239103.1 DUF5134 domain-containing protein [Pseudonocardia alni]